MVKSSLPHLTEDSAAWNWIADELAKGYKDSAIPRWECRGFCLMLDWMTREGVITCHRKRRMIRMLYQRFEPDAARGDRGHYLFFWRKGVRQPRIMAAQLMAMLPFPRARRYSV